jgi:S-adenosylmethionine synthetase
MGESMGNNMLEIAKEVCATVGMVTIPSGKILQSEKDDLNKAVKDLIQHLGLDEYWQFKEK